MTQLKIVTSEKLPVLQALAHKIWMQHYPGIITVEQIDYMLEKIYSIKSLQDQIDNNHKFYFLEKEDNEVGFLSYHVLDSNSSSVFLNKFYLDQLIAGKGMGTKFLMEFKSFLKPNTIKLTVNRKNFKSINFYFKNGFKIESVEDFDIGNGYQMNDFVMIWNK